MAGGLRDQLLQDGDQVSDQGISYRLPVARHNLVLGVRNDSLCTAIDFTLYVVGVIQRIFEQLGLYILQHGG